MTNDYRNVKSGYFLIFCSFSVFQALLERHPDRQNCLQCCVSGVPTAANISAFASVCGAVAALNVPVASAVSVDSAVADVSLLLKSLESLLFPLSARGISNISGSLILSTSLLLLVPLLW